MVINNLNWKDKTPDEMRSEKYKWDNKQGPCPSGYKVPVSSHYSAIKSATEKKYIIYIWRICV